MATRIRRARKIEIEKLRIWSMLHRARSAWPKRKEKNESSATCRKGGGWKVSVSKVIRATDSLHPRYRAHLFFTRAPRAKFFRRSNSRERGSTAKRSARWTLIRWGRKGEGGGKDIKGGPPREDSTKPPLRAVRFCSVCVNHDSKITNFRRLRRRHAFES